jgi:hypothetical protein
MRKVHCGQGYIIKKATFYNIMAHGSLITAVRVKEKENSDTLYQSTIQLVGYFKSHD